MATIEQIKALMKMHFDDNDERFRTIALQIAAHEALIGHTSSANEIKELVQKSKAESSRKVLRLPGRSELLEERHSNVRISDLVLPDELISKINRIIFEYKKRSVLRKNGLINRNKVLIMGAPGTGKTMTASVLSNEINLPLYVIQIDRLVTKYMGETSVKLRQVFDIISDIPGVYLFDEFDALGSDRSLDNDVGEMRRILNTFLMYLENDSSDSILMAATNNPKLLDKALFRRFDDVLEYTLPDKDEIEKLLILKLNGFATDGTIDKNLIERAVDLSHADIVNVCEEAIKQSLLNDRLVNKDVLISVAANLICQIIDHHPCRILPA